MSTIRLIDRKQGRQVLVRMCRESGVPVELVLKLIELEHEYLDAERRDGLRNQMDEIFDEFTDGDADVPASNSAA
ncbi:MAG: hypothetical protein RL199_2306 [Pseudomonadota bacterium]